MIIWCGVVLFFSFLYIGSISDKVIIELLGILDLLEFNDKVIVDKGFLIVDLLDKNKYFWWYFFFYVNRVNFFFVR